MFRASPYTLIRRDRHDRILNFDCLFKQHVSEWAVEQRHTIEALANLKKYIEGNKLHVHFPVEIRFGGSPHAHNQGDGIWLSPCHSTPQTWIGIIMYRPYGKDVEHKRYFRGFERILNVPRAGSPAGENATGPEFKGKPHWAKAIVSPISELDLASLYPRWNEFKALRKQLDPQGMFVNAYLQRIMSIDADGNDRPTELNSKPQQAQQHPQQQIQAKL
jgi:L-gulonolactone oxidase